MVRCSMRLLERSWTLPSYAAHFFLMRRIPVAELWKSWRIRRKDHGQLLMGGNMNSKPEIFRIGMGAVVAFLALLKNTSPAATDEPGFSWQRPHAKVLPTGGLEWEPRQFVFEHGDSQRFVDFDAGDDTQDGRTRQSAWRHHPWDANATGQAKACRGIQTYVFKGGTIYRGTLRARESGTPGNPIRLTCDPTWGNGPAMFYGSTRIKGGWKKANAAEAPGIPKPENVWYIDLGKGYDPDPDNAKFSAIWQIGGDKVQRLYLARKSKYELSDPNDPVKDWPTWSAYDAKTGTLTSPFLKGLGDKNLMSGAILWTEGDFLMGSATRYDAKWIYDPQSGSLSSLSMAHRSFTRIPRATVHFMIENVAQFLDAPGEYFFCVNGRRAGRLYLYPADGIDPNIADYEVGQIAYLLSLTSQHDITVSGLEFRYNDPDKGDREWTKQEGSPMPCVRILGNCANITVKNCKFYNVASAIWAGGRGKGDGGPADDVMDNILISDNDIQHAERGEALCVLGESESPKGAHFLHLQHVEVLRNRVFDTGFRHGYCPWASIPAICVGFPETAEIAGNMVDTSFGNGIITYGGKASGASNVVPLTRILVHHNQLDNTMLGCNDYGGLEHFQGGPVYLYDNVIHNCVGNRTLGTELGYSIYLDGGFKCYTFNNIVAGNIKPSQPDYYNNCGYFMVFGFMDQLFNNTLYHFNNALDGSSGNRSNILGNVMIDCKNSFIGQNRPGDVSMLGGGDAGTMGRIGIPTMAYASNVFFGDPKDFGCVAGSTTALPSHTLDNLREKLHSENCRLATIGCETSESPLINPAGRDYRPTANSGALGRGIKYFVPWALARTVGEWSFYKNSANPQIVLGESFYMTDEYFDRGMYYFIPRNNLTVSACTAADYVPSPLEDWIEGALFFDGKDRIAALSHAEMTRSMSYPGSKRGITNTYDGSKRATLDMGTNNFLIEIAFKTALGHTGGVLVSKMDKSGYSLAIGPDGGPELTIETGGAKASVASAVPVNDGKWHHLIGEVDRAASKVAIYIDGKTACDSKLDTIAQDAALSNTADFVVGKGFNGYVSFLRVCRSTLAESKTSIDELYAWEFNGPALTDFTGHAPAAGKTRDAGAIQSVK
jgi:hypothetical protein